MLLEKFKHIIEKSDITVCYFSHDECNVCKVLRPKIQEVIQTFPETAFLYINTKENPQISGQNMVFAVPTTIVFFEGRETKRFSRNISFHDFEMFLNRLSSNL